MQQTFLNIIKRQKIAMVLIVQLQTHYILSIGQQYQTLQLKVFFGKVAAINDKDNQCGLQDNKCIT